TIEAGGITDTIDINVIAEITSINIVEAELDLITPEIFYLSVTVLNAAGNPVIDPSLTFTTSNAGIVSVNFDGILTAESAGTATITVAGGGESDTVVVTVFAAASGGLSAIGSEFIVSIGDEIGINDLFVARDAGGVIIVDPELVFTTTDVAVVTVDATGMLVAHAAGNALVTVTSPHATGSATVRLHVLDALDALNLAIEIFPATATLAVAATVDLDVTGELFGDPVEVLAVFTSGNPAVATVDPLTGEVTAVAVGIATITAATGALTAEAVITVE
ncbi:MAG TPA: Ig-like domain-containing protein, partial [Gemmatimonadota bacterium]|nr:Ig-like domain-containing protein [Gemmatimonadota bacterium]